MRGPVAILAYCPQWVARACEHYTLLPAGLKQQLTAGWHTRLAAWFKSARFWVTGRPLSGTLGGRWHGLAGRRFVAARARAAEQTEPGRVASAGRRFGRASADPPGVLAAHQAAVVEEGLRPVRGIVAPVAAEGGVAAQPATPGFHRRTGPGGATPHPVGRSAEGQGYGRTAIGNRLRQRRPGGRRIAQACLPHEAGGVVRPTGPGKTDNSGHRTLPDGDYCLVTPP